jgi:hypothetical protein
MIYKSIVGAVCACLAVVSFNVNAALSGGETLSFFDGVWDCHPIKGGGTYPNCDNEFTTATVSYFAFDTNHDGIFDLEDRVAMKNANPGVGGITLGSPQNPGEIDLDWQFSSIDGRHATNTALGVPSVNADGSVDMSGWSMTWVSPGPHDLGNGAPAIITCTSGTFTCANGEEFTLDYTAVIPSGALVDVRYQLHLEGVVISAVPIPAAVWLFGSGLIGLISIARRKKS